LHFFVISYGEKQVTIEFITANAHGYGSHEEPLLLLVTTLFVRYNTALSVLVHSSVHAIDSTPYIL
jgi:hypothetical protein